MLNICELSEVEAKFPYHYGAQHAVQRNLIKYRYKRP